MPYANNKGADQPAHPRSLISAFFIRCLDSKIPLLAIAEISRLRFPRDVALIFSRENLSSGVATRVDSNRPALLQGLARDLKFWM